MWSKLTLLTLLTLPTLLTLNNMSRKHAVDQYERLIQSAPRWYLDVNDFLDVYEYYEDEGRLADADVCLRYALQLHPDDELLLVKKAYALRSSGKVAEATALIDRLNPELLEVRFFKAEEALASFRVEEANKIFRDMLVESGGGDSPVSPDMMDWGLHVDVAECYVAEGFWDEALYILRNIPDDAPDAKQVHLMRAECYYNQRDFDAAVAEVNAAIDVDSYAVEAWSMLAELQYENQHFTEAQEACEYALAINADDEKSLRINYFAHACLNHSDEALAVARHYVECWPNEYYLPMNAGELCLQMDNPDEAMSFLGRANVNCHPEHPDHDRILTDVARVQAKQGHYEQSFQTVKRLYRRDHQYEQVCLQMAAIAAENGNMDFACLRLEEIASKVVPGNNELIANIFALLHEYPILYTKCPTLAVALQRLNTSTTL